MYENPDDLWQRPCLNCGRLLNPSTVNRAAAQALYKCKSCGMRFALQFQPWSPTFKALRSLNAATHRG